jgi:hypothetical protein
VALNLHTFFYVCGSGKKTVDWTFVDKEISDVKREAYVVISCRTNFVICLNDVII